MSFITRAIRRRRARQVDSLLEGAVRRGWNPLQAQRAAIEAECGLPPLPNERISDYAARAAGVSRETIDRYLALRQAGISPEPGMAILHAFFGRIGRRLAHLAFLSGEHGQQRG
jgi:hypothetical protein